ncbi:MAG TPA: T9SS type A sorting domain-containing protein [Chitinophagaceae bacterium]|nr:T9SS type A sorting domain-containing protein [Chitinophagaceae bacterium]
MRKIILSTLLGLCAHAAVQAQTYSSSGAVAIPDGPSATCGIDGTAGVSSISVPLTGTIGTPSDVTINISFIHDFVGDIRVELVAPDASSCILMNHIGAAVCEGASGNLVAANVLSFNAAYVTSIPATADPGVVPGGNYAPTGSTAFPAVGNLSTFLSGKTVSGSWSIRAIDNYNSFTGTISSWNMVFGATALPLELVSFKGTTYKGYNNLRWESGVEKDVARMELERSVNGLGFEKIRSILPLGNNSRYEHNDQLDAQGAILYRLRIVDKDGTVSYSSVVKLMTSAGTEQTAAIASYDPASTSVTLLSGGEALSGTTVRLLNTIGVVLQEFTINGNAHTIDMSTYPAAVYFLKLANGSTVKFVKQD